MGKAEALRLGVGAANALMRVTWAPECAACTASLQTPLDGCVCAACWSRIEPAPRVEWPAGPLVRAGAGGNYSGALRQIIHAFKYEGRRSLARPLVDVMKRAGADVLDGADCVVPVPLHAWRRLQRGFNQATDLADLLGPPVRPVLWRIRATAPQADLTAAQRRHNVGAAFHLSPVIATKAREELRGQVVVLVDDVRTTGATLHACAEVLAAAGVREVRALTAAVRSPGDGEHTSGLQSPSSGRVTPGAVRSR